MRIRPDSTINLYAGVDIDNGEQLVFSSRANQTAYFQTKLVRAQTPCTVVRKSGRLRVEIAGSVISTCNYLSFVNPSFDNKTVYARIIDYDYINNECVEISYAIDYWQTWMFDVTFEDMYIEREHLSQADFDKAEDNPYDPSIFEFKTAETLPIGKDLEKKIYNIGADDTYDGLQVANAIEGILNVDGTVGILIKIAEIDFADLDSVDPDTSKPFAQYLEKIGNEPLGYYYLTDKMGTYLAGKYNGQGGNPMVYNNSRSGSEWRDHSLTPCSSSKFNPSCVIIYDPDGGEALHRNGHMSELLQVLTQLGASEQIISMHMIPNNLFAYSCNMSNGEFIKIGQLTAQTTLPQVNNKKLMRYPFSYVREIAPNGDVKELHYEDFAEVINGNLNYIQVCCVMDVAEQPTLILAPYKYHYTGMSDNDNANITEALIFAQFPSAPYNIDAYTAQIAAEAINNIAGRTEDAAWAMSNAIESTSKKSSILDTMSTIWGSISGSSPSGSLEWATYGGSSGVVTRPIGGTADIGAMGAIGGAINAAAKSYQSGIDYTTARGQAENAAERWNGADSALTGEDGNAIASQLRLTKPAYACDKYFMSNGSGVINFNRVSFTDINVVRVQLNPDILALYDRWFDYFGYNSGRCGIPRVINYMIGETQDSLTPAWATINNKRTTYVKTLDCKVIHSMIPVASFIKNMFDSGIRFIQGDYNGENL